MGVDDGRDKRWLASRFRSVPMLALSANEMLVLAVPPPVLSRHSICRHGRFRVVVPFLTNISLVCTVDRPWARLDNVALWSRIHYEMSQGRMGGRWRDPWGKMWLWDSWSALTISRVELNWD